MSNTYLAYNSLQHKYRQQRKHVIEIISGVAFIIAASVTLFYYTQNKFILLGVVAGLIIVVISTKNPWNQLQITKAGIKGETSALDQLKELPDNYEVFHSIEVESEREKGEIDIVVVGENGVFLIEVKNYTGILTGCEGDKKWLQTKVSKAGRRYESQVRNPLQEVDRHKRIFLKELMYNGINSMIIPVVFLVNPQSKSNIHFSTMFVFASGQKLCNYIVNYQPQRKLNEAEINRIRELLINKQKDTEKRLKGKVN